jgi:hypothetical protein
MDLLDYLCEETRDKKTSHRAGKKTAIGRKAPAVLLAGLSSSINVI